MADDIVKFLMPDGTEVSNDSRFMDNAERRAERLAATPNTGDAGNPVEDEEAQRLAYKAATLNSGQPGVGENAVPDDATKDLHGPLGSPAQRRQKEDAKEAAERGGSPQETADEDPDPEDSNERVLELRKKREERREAAMRALEEAGEGEGDPDQPYSEWSAKQLKAEVAKRNADGRSEEEMLELKGKKKADVAKLLEQDDARSTGGGTTGE